MRRTVNMPRSVISIYHKCGATLAILSLTLSIGCIAVPGNAHAINFTWMLKNAVLEEGKLFPLKYIHANGKVTFTDPRYTVTCNKLEGKNAGIEELGRGTHEEELEFKECKVTTPATGCRVTNEKITTEPLKGEIVEGVGASAGALLLSFNGKNNGVGELVVSISIEKVGAEACAPSGAGTTLYLYNGTLLAQALNPSEEVVIQKFKLEAKEPHNYKAFNGKNYGAGLKSGCNSLMVSGELLTELESGEPFGPF
jgi:hypothetical protein